MNGSTVSRNDSAPQGSRHEHRPASVDRRRRNFVTTLLLLTLAGLGTWSGCRTTPIAGRRQLLLIPEKQEVAMGVDAYEDILKKETLSANPQYVEMVERVGRRIAAVAEQPDYQWQFKVIASEQTNAFALPGGKVAFYEGILPICQTEAGIAVVMSHEIAHALARHGGERMSHTALSTAVKKAVEFGASEQSEKERELILGAYGAASKFGVTLPYSRKHESEADHIGLMLMAKAGYDPTEAPRFWERFAQLNAGQKPAEFLSTHPSDAHRAAALRELLPEAHEYYAKATTKYGMGEALITNETPLGKSIRQALHSQKTSTFAPTR
jgi:predicted Zn-dependent protease